MLGIRNRLVFALVLIGLAVAPSASATAAGGLEGIPAFSHIVLLTMENEDAATTFAPGSPATYLNSLKSQGTYLPQYYGTSHVSLGNYVTMVSGQLSGPTFDSDCLGQSLYTCAQGTSAQANGRHLGDQLDDAHVSWRSYMDSTPTPCFHAPYVAGDVTPDPYQGDSQKPPAGDYADRHNPFIYFTDFVGNDARCTTTQRPYTELPGVLSAGTLPRFAFVTPDTCHDGHDSPCSNGQPGGLVSADLWAKSNVPPLLSYLQANNGLLVINFDEGAVQSAGQETCTSCASGGAGGRTGALVLGAGVVAGKVVATGYDHHSLLRTIEDSFGITEHLNMAGRATAMTDVFSATPPPVVPEVPHAPLLPLIGVTLGAIAIYVLRRRGDVSTPRK